MNQHTLRETYRFRGKGLHTGAEVEMTILPAPDNYGIVFQRIDLGDELYVEASVDNLWRMDRSTCLSKDGVQIFTTEHLMAALSGMGVDNALVQLDAPEIPILDGSALPFVEAIKAIGLTEQRSERIFLTPEQPFEYFDNDSGSQILVIPSDNFEVDVTIDFNSKVLGVQEAHFDHAQDFASQIACCRTFCFFHELEKLVEANLIRGGNMDNAIVVVEDEVDKATIDRVGAAFGVDNLERLPQGYLSNVALHFDNECARHKLLDVMGDFALLGHPLNAKVIARKPGHRVNTCAASILSKILKQS